MDALQGAEACASANDDLRTAKLAASRARSVNALLAATDRRRHRIEDFWEYADRGGGVDACWPWRGAVSQGTGYGTFSVTGSPRGAHRVAWELSNGRKPGSGSYVCHRCDNPICVNPAHLFIGSPRDNARDMIAKGRAGGPLNENAAKTACPRGHAYDATGRRGDGSTFRVCSQCERAAKQAYKRRQREKRRG